MNKLIFSLIALVALALLIFIDDFGPKMQGLTIIVVLVASTAGVVWLLLALFTFIESKKKGGRK